MSWSCTTPAWTWVLPTVAQFKSLFARDFPYAPSTDANNTDYVLDADISQGLLEANIDFNPDLGFIDLPSAQTIFLYLSAYYLVFNIQNSQKGLAAGSVFSLASSGVGSVNVSYSIPERYMKDPVLAMYTQNRYGMKYISLVLPYLTGNVNTIIGTTTYT